MRSITSIAVAVVVGILLRHFGEPLFDRAKTYFTAPKSELGVRGKGQRRQPQGEVANFALVDHQGDGHELYREYGAKAIVIIAHLNDCPIVQKYARKISSIKQLYGPKNVQVYLLNSNPSDKREDILKQEREYPTNVPILLDPSQVVAKNLGFTRSAETVVIDPKGWRIVYRGPIDDGVVYGTELSQTKNEFLSNALEDFLHDRAPRRSDTRGVLGCAITYLDKDRSFTYVRDIAPILRDKCLQCHSSRTGKKPFIDDYESAKAWAAMIRDTVVTRRMPPLGWDLSVKNDYHPLITSRDVKPDQVRAIAKWVDDGMLRGEGADPLVFAAKRAGSFEKRGPPPDIEFANVEVAVPPTGFTEYKYYQIGGPMERDMYLVGTNLRSTNPSTIHHQMLIVSKAPITATNARTEAMRDEKLVANDREGKVPLWDLGQMHLDNADNDDFARVHLSGYGKKQPALFSHVWKENYGVFIPKGAYLILETHYHGTGKDEKEVSTVGLYLNKKKELPKKLFTTNQVSMINNIRIPPGAKNYKVTADPIVLAADTGILSLGIHMHMRGKSARVLAFYPDGREEIIASHPFFDVTFSNARPILFQSGKIFPKGTAIRMECIYDNSAANPFNPDPQQKVGWGQTLDRSEMCMAYPWTYLPDKNQRQATR